MKSLLDIQQDIRNLETSMNEITARINGINTDLNELRNASQNTRSQEADYSKIAILAKRLPFEEHPLYSLDDGEACRMYLEMLLNIVRMDRDSEITVNRLIFIQWLQIQADIDWSLEELFMDACEMQQDSYREFIEIIPEEYVENFMLDAFITANIGGTANGEIMEYLSNMSDVLGITVERVQILSSVAYAVLCRNFKAMERKEAEKVLDCAQMYSFYIDSDMIKNAIQMQREIVVKCPDSDYSLFRWKAKQGQLVERGDCIAETETYETYGYLKIKGNNSKTKKLKAPSSGVLFQFKINCVNYGVISISTDSKEEIKAWVKAGGM